MKLSPVGRRAGCVVLGLVAACVALVASLRAQTDGGAPTVLPPVDVHGGAPLVKVGDFKLLEARFGPAVVADGDYIYTIGGQDTGRSAMDSVERFNVRTGQSEPFAKLHTPRYWHSAVVAGGKIYVLGGINGQSMQMHSVSAPPSGDLLAGRRVTMGSPGPGSEMEMATTMESSMEIIDLATGGVSAGVPMPDARVQFACAVLGGKIYVLGGNRVGPRVPVRTNDVRVFDLKRQTWSKGEAMPGAFNTAAVIVDPGLVVVAGGYDGDRPRTEVSVYNPGDKLWRTLPPLHRGVSAHSLAFLGHYLFLFGDFLSPGELVAYDLITKRSESFALDYQKARYTAAVVHEGKVYVVGGRVVTDAESVDYIQVYALRQKG
jgi:hypothetical protein